MTLAFEHVSKVVAGQVHIADLSVSLAPGSLNVLLGPTLAGKTTLLRLMAGLDQPTSGRILMDGQDCTGVSVRKRDVAMVYQQFINYPSFTVYENIASPLRRSGVGREEIDRRVRTVAKMLHIEPLLDRLPAEISGGQQQRTALARALAKDAKLLLLDEPLVNLDYKLREEFREEIRSLIRGRDSIVVYATTEPQEALAMGGHLLVLSEGKLLQAGSTHDVYQRPASVRVGEVFSDPPINLIRGHLAEGEVLLGDQLRVPRPRHMTHLPDGPYRFGVRANHLFAQRRHDSDVAVAGVMELAEISGSETFIHIGHSGVSWIAELEGVHTYELGERVSVYLNPDTLFLFDPDDNLAAAPSGSRHESAPEPRGR
jgi:glycerol transport system ATP-binding protein